MPKVLASGRKLAVLLAAVLPACVPGPSGEQAALSARLAHVRACDSGSGAAPLPEGCGLVCRAELPMRLVADKPLVTVWIDNQPAELIFDVGAGRSNITAIAARRLGLGPAVAASGKVIGIGGVQPRFTVHARSMAFSHVRLADPVLEMVAMVAPTGGTLPDGSLGNDILRNYEIDLDLPHHRVTLYQGRPCDGRLPGWASVDGWLPLDPKVLRWPDFAVPASLDGHPVLALIDSGADATLVSAPAAESLGVPAAELNRVPDASLFGVGSNTVFGHLHRFHRLEVAGQATDDVESAIAVLPFARPQMVLGTVFLSTHKVWISNATERAYFAHTW